MTNYLASTNFLGTINNITADVYLTGKTNLAAAVDFVSTQAPQVAQEYIFWHIAENSVELIVTLFSFLLPIFIFLFVSKKMLQSEYSFIREGAYMVRVVVAIVALACLAPIALKSSNNVKEILKAKYSPRIVLIEKAAGLVSGKK